MSLSGLSETNPKSPFEIHIKSPGVNFRIDYRSAPSNGQMKIQASLAAILTGPEILPAIQPSPRPRWRRTFNNKRRIIPPTAFRKSRVWVPTPLGGIFPANSSLQPPPNRVSHSLIVPSPSPHHLRWPRNADSVIYLLSNKTT